MPIPMLPSSNRPRIPCRRHKPTTDFAILVISASSSGWE
ncbi:hypothetical protein LINPERPRIM_LOCUS4988 [Linum perenne]